MFLSNIGCIGHLVTSLLSVCHNDVRNVLFQNGGRDWTIFQCKCYENQDLPHLRRARKRIYHECKGQIDKFVPPVTVWHHSASLGDAKVTLRTDLSINPQHSCAILIF